MEKTNCQVLTKVSKGKKRDKSFTNFKQLNVP